jgi:excinuclease ABC subunit B
MYADRTTDSMKGAIEETNRRREVQERFNKEHNITPTTIKKAVEKSESEVVAARNYSGNELAKMVVELQEQMEAAADSLDFEKAIELRDKVRELKKAMADKEK